jgi:hypothetical protein
MNGALLGINTCKWDEMQFFGTNGMGKCCLIDKKQVPLQL